MTAVPSSRRAILRELFLHPLVLVVLALKLFASAFFAGGPIAQWFTPFVGYFTQQGFADPWDAFFKLGQLKAFPYPPGMLYAFAVPRWLAGGLIGGSWMDVGPAQLLVMRLPLLAADLLVFAILGLWFRDRLAMVRLWWWCSPVVFYVSYFHGQLDLVPTALFLASLFLLERHRHLAGFAVFGLALATKSHLWIALPFMLIYLRGRLGLARLAALSLLAAAIAVGLSLPYSLRPAYQAMVLQAEEQSWVFSLGVPMGRFGAMVLLCPAALLFILARFGAYPRHNWDLTLLFIGLAFSAFVLLVPPMPGWYLWSLPFLIYYFCRFPGSAGPLLLAYSGAFLAYFLLGSRGDLAQGLALVAPQFHWPEGALAAWVGPGTLPVANNLYFTLLQGSLATAMLLMYTRGVRSNDVYGARERPLMIGVAGDSGAGKDVLAETLTRLLGEREVIRLAGDDYHRWERGHDNWKSLTHLNPRSNRLHEQLQHAVALRQGESIEKVEYDHSTGRFTGLKSVDPAKNIIVQGLHTFLLEGMRGVFDLKVFLDPDERLRLFWKLRRDGLQRGHKASAVKAAVRKRAGDRDAAILPQRQHADLVFRLLPLEPKELKRLESEPRLGLEITARNSFDLESLADALGSLPGVKATVDYPKGLSHVRVRVQGGPIPKRELDRLALSLVPNLQDLAGTQPEFEDGWQGVMSLAVLACLSGVLRLQSRSVLLQEGVRTW